MCIMFTSPETVDSGQFLSEITDHILNWLFEFCPDVIVISAVRDVNKL